MSDRNLHAFEEYDLGARLRQKGWKLLRMPDHAATHYGHQLSTPALMWLRIRSGSFASYGKLMRASYEKHYIFRLLRELRAIQLSSFIVAFWTSELLLSLFAPALALASSTVAVTSFVVLMAVKRRSLALGVFTVLTWHLGAAGLIVGLFKPRTPPRRKSAIRSGMASQAWPTLQRNASHMRPSTLPICFASPRGQCQWGRKSPAPTYRTRRWHETTMFASLTMLASLLRRSRQSSRRRRFHPLIVAGSLNRP